MFLCQCSHEGFLRAEFDSETKRSNCVKPFVYSEKNSIFLIFLFTYCAIFGMYSLVLTNFVNTYQIL